MNIQKTADFIIEEVKNHFTAECKGSNQINDNCLISYLQSDVSVEKKMQEKITSIIKQYENENLSIAVNFPKKIMSEETLSDTNSMIVFELVIID